MSTPYEAGAEVIRAFLKTAPSLPGVYRMVDAKGEVLYVGKAKILRNRVANYVNPSGLSFRIMTMVGQTRAMEVTITRTEAEALLLEANLIKKFLPRYNILLRDDKSFPGILLTGDHDFPQVVKHRGAAPSKGRYFGPYASAYAVNATLTILQRAFLLRPCSDTVFKNRTRPCLQYQIRRCSAPCVGYISEAEYGALIGQAEDFLSGKSREIQDRLAHEMQQASAAQDYEKAASLRDRIRALTAVQQQQSFITLPVEQADLFALHREGGRSCMQVFIFRGGQNFGNKAYFPAHAADSTDADILSAFLGQFYQTRVPPKLILTSVTLPDASLLEEALAINTTYKVELRRPERGEMRAAMEQALLNARSTLQARLAEQTETSGLLMRVAELFGLEAPPSRIEVYDNSHIAGSHAVGAMIVAGPEGFMKKHYRRYNFRMTELRGEARTSSTLSTVPVRIQEGEKDTIIQDDYAMMREVFTRRFSRLQREDPDRDRALWPDLVLVDGGKGQLSSVLTIFQELGIEDVPIVAISKGPDRNAGREWLHMEGRESFQLSPQDPVLHYLQRLRDEAHRFAVGSHRIKRANALRNSPLDDIPGVGGARRKALLHHFGSAKAVEDSTLEELKKVPGVSAGLAFRIYRYFHPQ